MLQSLVTGDYDKQSLVRFIVVVVPGTRRNLFSVMTVAKRGIITIFDYENPTLEGFNVTKRSDCRLQRENGPLCVATVSLGPTLLRGVLP